MGTRLLAALAEKRRRGGGGERMVGLEKLPDGTIEKRFASVNDCLAMDT